MTIKERLNCFLNNIYIPILKREEAERLRELAETSNLRMPNANDAHKTGYVILIIKTKGKGRRETYDSYEVKNVDFSSIGGKYALAYLYDSEGNGNPCRLDITSIKNILIS